MRKRLLLSVLLVVGCSKVDQKPATLRWQLPEGESLAYKVTAEASAVVDGEDKGSQEMSGYLFVDVEGKSAASIHLDTGQPIFGVTSMELNPASTNFFFPLPEVPLADQPVTQALTIDGVGTTATQTNPDINLTETLARTAADGDTVSLTFSRKGKTAAGTPVRLELEEEGKGSFDIKAGRYQRLERTTRMTLAGTFGGENVSMSTTVKFTMEFDRERSGARTKERAQRRQPPVSGEALAEYLKANPVDAEIAAVVRAQENGSLLSAALFFHLRANPVATWKQAMELPAEQREGFASGVAFLTGRGKPIPQELADWFKSELPKQDGLAIAVANMPDERLREQLVALAALTGAEKEEIAKRAGESLKAIDAQKAGPGALLTASEQEFMEIAMALQAEGQDHRALASVLIQLLERSQGATSQSKVPIDDLAVQWLEGLVSRSYGKDVAAWKKFWEANKEKSYCRWMIEAAGQDTMLLVNNALSRLASCRDSREATEYLAKRVEKDTGDSRRFAALSLAEHRDERAIPVLIGMLADDNPQLRAGALVALANFHETTLGYDPAGDEPSRAAALRRWRAWANSYRQR